MIDIEGKDVLISAPMENLSENSLPIAETYAILKKKGAASVYDPTNWSVYGTIENEECVRQMIIALTDGWDGAFVDGAWENTVADVVVQCGDWQQSESCHVIASVAEACGKPCVSIDELIDTSKDISDMTAKAANREDILIEGIEYMAYPVDGDGVQIHLGDKVSWSGFPDKHGKVKFLYIADDGTWRTGIEIDDSPLPQCYCASDLHHCRRKCVKDVLTELLDMVTGESGDYGDIVDAYANLLCLKEVDD